MFTTCSALTTGRERQTPSPVRWFQRAVPVQQSPLQLRPPSSSLQATNKLTSVRGAVIAAYVPFFHLATSFADYLQLHIFGPLGMSSTGVSITAAQKSGHMTTGYTREGVSKEDPMGTRGRAMYPHLENDEGEVNWGAGGVIMSLSDAVSTSLPARVCDSN